MSSLKQTSTGSCGRKCFKSFPPLVFHVRSSHDLMLLREGERKRRRPCIYLSRDKMKIYYLLPSSWRGKMCLSFLRSWDTDHFSISTLIVLYLCLQQTLLKQLLIEVFLPHSWSLGVQSDTLSLPSSHFSFFFPGLRDVFYSWLILIKSHSSYDTRRESKRERKYEWEKKTPPNIPGLSLAASLSLRAWKKVFRTFCHCRSQEMFVFLSPVSHHTCYAVRPFKINHVFLYFQANSRRAKKRTCKTHASLVPLFLSLSFFHYFSEKE